MNKNVIKNMVHIYNLQNFTKYIKYKTMILYIKKK